MGAKITNARLTIETLVHAGFRSTASALAELVDNSIEAEAKKIRIIATNKRSRVKQRTQNNIHELAVLDNGGGMNYSDLSNCLSLGWGTRLEKREGLGRFGFGLKGSSISQCRRISVYSWQDGTDNCNVVEMDIDKIIKDDLEELPDPKRSKLPRQYKAIVSEIGGDSGTLVCWQNLKNVDVKKTDALTRRLNKDLCRLYRHFLDDDDTYGERRDIQVLTIEEGKYKPTGQIELLANDPLYLLKPSNVPGFESEAIFLEWEEMYTIKIETTGNNFGNVSIRASIAKPEIQSLTGGSEVGKHCADNTGISFVRAGREIDFGDFGYIDSYDPRNRWWGIEIRFDPILDEIFGVTNNKQYVRNIKRLSDAKREDFNDTKDDENRDLDYYKAKGLLEIDHHLEKLVKEMMKIVRSRGEGKLRNRGVKNTSEIVNEEVTKDLTPTMSGEESGKKDDANKRSSLISLFQNSDTSLTDADAAILADEAFSHKVDLAFGEWPGKMLLTLEFPANGAVGVINRNHNFYEDFWLHLEKLDDPKGIEAMKVLLLAFVRAEDEMSRRHNGPYYEDLRESWGKWCHMLLEKVR
jgi:hypothetical protein